MEIGDKIEVVRVTNIDKYNYVKVGCTGTIIGIPSSTRCIIKFDDTNIEKYNNYSLNNDQFVIK